MKAIQAFYLRLWCAAPSVWFAALLARSKRHLKGFYDPR